MRDALGDELDSSDKAVEFLVGGSDLLPAIEQALVGKAPGDQVDLYLEPEHAFGEYDEKLVFLEPRSLFSGPLQEGVALPALPPGASSDAPADLRYYVSGIYPDHVILDGNHPLAGIALQLKLVVASVRLASEQELRARSAGVGFFNGR